MFFNFEIEPILTSRMHPPVVIVHKRSVEVETVFGHVKHNMGFRRFHLRGLQKVKTEWGLVSIAHNMKKLAAI
jgi:hypothetical protein